MIKWNRRTGKEKNNERQKAETDYGKKNGMRQDPKDQK